MDCIAFYTHVRDPGNLIIYCRTHGLSSIELSPGVPPRARKGNYCKIHGLSNIEVSPGVPPRARKVNNVL